MNTAYSIYKHRNRDDNYMIRHADAARGSCDWHLDATIQPDGTFSFVRDADAAKLNSTPDVSCKFGAPMGRPTRNTYTDKQGQTHEITDIGTRPMSLIRIRLNSGGYDAGGAYWGHGLPLYYYESFVSDISGYVRGRTREDAKAEVRKMHPLATFYR